MERTTAQHIAKLANVNVKTVRKYADRGHIESRRDLNGWRIFPNPEEAAKIVRGLLLGEIKSAEINKVPCQKDN